MGTLHLALSGATVTPEETAPDLVRLLQDRGWRVTVLCTPAGTRFHDLDALEALTGEPVRVDFRRPGTGTSLPPPDAVLACPWSFTVVWRGSPGVHAREESRVFRFGPPPALGFVNVFEYEGGRACQAAALA
ncbi:hypothetical protein ACFXKD_16915 [Nocardiopsis aegyptia]|uniref:hypothetical protein n=1 Tax=Nocardiopsis aegyptia TaxID=220378 RepID=UPI00366D4BA6